MGSGGTWLRRRGCAFEICVSVICSRLDAPFSRGFVAMRRHPLGGIRILAREIIRALLPPIVPENQARIVVALGCGEKKVVRLVMPLIFAFDEARFGVGFAWWDVMAVGLGHVLRFGQSVLTGRSLHGAHATASSGGFG